MHTKRQMHSARSIKMQMSFIHGGNICVRRESVFRLSMGRPAPAVSAWVCARSWILLGGHNGRSNPRKRSWYPQYLSWSNLYSTTDSVDQWHLRRQLLHHDFQGGAASILIDISFRVRRIFAFYIARKTDKRDPILFKYLGLPDQIVRKCANENLSIEAISI